MSNKTQITDLAIFGGTPIFDKIRSTSNLVQPNKEAFFKYAKQSFDQGWLTNNGPAVRLMESRLAELHQVKNVIAVCNGLWAIVVTAFCLAIKGRNEIVMPSLTYRRMADIAAWLKLTPHFSDVDLNSMGITKKNAESVINENTAIIIGAHPIVNLCDIDGLVDLSNKYKIPIIFDSVEAAYASHNNQMLGSFGNAECFSMHASKFLNGFEAGYITTDDDELAEKLKIIRGFGFRGSDNIEELGINIKLNDLHAAMALASLDDLHDQITRNKERYRKYQSLLSVIDGIDLIEYSEFETRTFKNILVRLNENWPLSRDNTLSILHKENMLARPYYYPPLHEKKTHYKTITGDMTNTTKLMNNHMLLPCGEFVNVKDVEDIVTFLNFLQKNGNKINSLIAKEKVA